jgi:RNA polymerase sigma factor (sigma-70 family)
MDSESPMSWKVLNERMKEYFDVLTQSARGLVRNKLDIFDGLAEDTNVAADILLHEGYIEAVRTILSGETRCRSFCSWFVGIMDHRLRRMRQGLKQKRLQLQQMPQSTLSSVQEQPLEDDPLDSFPSLISIDPEHCYVACEQVNWLLSFLDERDRTIVDLYVFRGLSGPEIAQRFGWSLDQFHTHLHYVFRRLRTILQERTKD